MEDGSSRVIMSGTGFVIDYASTVNMWLLNNASVTPVSTSCLQLLPVPTITKLLTLCSATWTDVTVRLINTLTTKWNWEGLTLLAFFVNKCCSKVLVWDHLWIIHGFVRHPILRITRSLLYYWVWLLNISIF